MLRVLGVAATYQVRPSEILHIQDSYTAYCLDEACAFIQTKLREGEEPQFTRPEDEPVHTHYSSPSELFKQYDNFNG